MNERLTKWEGCDPDGTPRAVLAKREGSWVKNMDEAIRKLAKFEDEEELGHPRFGKPMTDEEMAKWICDMIKKQMGG